MNPSFTPEQMTILQELREELLGVASQTPTVEVKQNASDTKIKFKEPESYLGDRKDLPRFFTQLEFYFRVRTVAFPDDNSKVMYAISLMRGVAFEWIQPYIQSSGNLEVAWLKTWTDFKAQLFRSFGEPDMERSAEASLDSLKQRGSVSVYASEFIRYSSYTRWNDAAKIHQFRAGLKETVKDELARLDRIESLQDLINTGTLGTS